MKNIILLPVAGSNVTQLIVIHSMNAKHSTSTFFRHNSPVKYEVSNTHKAPQLFVTH